MYREVVFDTAQVVLTWEGDARGCRLTASDPGWAPFAEVVTALFAQGVVGRADLAAVTIAGVAVAPAEAHASPALRAFWSKHLGWTEDEPPITYWSFLRPGTEDGALMPDLAVWRWLAAARAGYAEVQQELDLAARWVARSRAAQARVDREPRTVDWSGDAPVDLIVANHFPALPDGEVRPPPAVLDALEARAVNFDDLHPAEPATHVIRELVMSAFAAAGVFDPPDDGRRARALASRPTLRSWRDASLAWAELAEALPALRPPGTTHPLASPVALDWFRRGPYAGPDHSPQDWLRWHLRNWQEEDRTAPGHFDLFARALSGRVTWHTGVADLQQLASAGTPERDLPWAARCTVRAAVCTQGGAFGAGALIAAALAAGEPGNWHGWLELGVAMGRLATQGLGGAVPFRVAGKPFDRYGAAGGCRASTARAVALHPSLKGASILQELEAELEDHRLFHSNPPVPLDAFPAELLAGAETEGLRATFERLPAHVRRYVLAPDFVGDLPALWPLAGA